MKIQMSELVKSIKDALAKKHNLPFSAYTSVKEQILVNVPLVNPTLIFVLNGQKKLGREGSKVCNNGEFVFFSGGVDIDMRNIPANSEYFALLIEFAHEDFSGIEATMDSNTIPGSNNNYFIGKIHENLEQLLQQFIQWSLWAPAEIWALRRREILQVINHLGYSGVSSMAGPPSLSRRVYQLLRDHVADDVTAENICNSLSMSESTLRRRLKQEKTTFQTLKDNVTLGQGLHLLQSSRHAIGYIAAECGYQSQSRFSQRFKEKFGMTPSELRKTRG